MTTPTVTSKRGPPGMIRHENNVPALRTYLTKTSFVAVHFDQAGKGRIIFLPCGATLQVIEPSLCLREGFSVMFEGEVYNVFAIDLFARARLVYAPIRANGCAVAVCA
jgi:hypothetical protein